jgi:hypothetical protein
MHTHFFCLFSPSTSLLSLHPSPLLLIHSTSLPLLLSTSSPLPHPTSLPLFHSFTPTALSPLNLTASPPTNLTASPLPNPTASPPSMLILFQCHSTADCRYCHSASPTLQPTRLHSSPQFHLAPPIPSFLHSSSLPAATTGHFRARLITVLPVILPPIPLHTLSHLYFLPRPVHSHHFCLRPHSQVAGRGNQRGGQVPWPSSMPPRVSAYSRPHPASRLRFAHFSSHRTHHPHYTLPVLPTPLQQLQHQRGTSCRSITSLLIAPTTLTAHLRFRSHRCSSRSISGSISGVLI